MKKTKLKFRQAWIGKCILLLAISVVFMGSAFAAQFDNPLTHGLFFIGEVMVSTLEYS